MIAMGTTKLLAVESTPTADEAEAFLRDVRRLTDRWNEGLLSTEELERSVASLPGAASLPRPLLSEYLPIPRD